MLVIGVLYDNCMIELNLSYIIKVTDSGRVRGTCTKVFSNNSNSGTDLICSSATRKVFFFKFPKVGAISP